MPMEQHERLTLTVPEVAARLGLSRNGAYEAVATGQIPAIRIGRRVLVPRAALDRLLEQASAAPHVAIDRRQAIVA